MYTKVVVITVVVVVVVVLLVVVVVVVMAFLKYTCGTHINNETYDNLLCRLFVNCSRALERKSRIISGPSNFSHVAHMGPDQGMKALIELPVVKLLSHLCFDVQTIL